MLLFNHRQTGKDPIDTCFRQQMGHKRWNYFQRVYLFVYCHGLNQGATISGWILLPFQSMEKKNLFVWIMPNRPLARKWVGCCWSFTDNSVVSEDIVLLKCSICKPDVWNMNIHTCRTLNRPMKVYWKTIGNTRIFLRMQSTTVLFKNRFSFIRFKSNSI